VPKKRTKAQEFEQYRADYRAGRAEAPGVLAGATELSDDTLKWAWEDVRRREARHKRDAEYVKRAKELMKSAA
jgi:hypothetical protein